MITDIELFYAFLLVFVRCSAMLFSSPIFGAQNTPVQIRIFTTLAISMALTAVVQPDIGPHPTDIWELLSCLFRESLAGLVIGTFTTLAMHAFEIAGSLMDLQTGLSSSSVINPVNGVQTTVLSQFKNMLSIVVFLAADGHHMLFEAFVRSYRYLPTVGAIQGSYLELLNHVFLIALQIAAPVMAVGFLVDAALGLVNRAVPQLQAMQVGTPAKVGAGLLAVSLGLPAMVSGVNMSLEAGFRAMEQVFRF